MHTLYLYSFLTLLYLTCLGPLSARAQTSNAYCEGDVTLSTQAEVDAFDCAVVENLTINANHTCPNPITNLKSLCSLVTVTGSLTINGGPQLTTLEGLHKLESIENDFSVIGLTAQDFTGLKSLTSTGELLISDSQLESFQGLDNLQIIYGNFNITNTTGLTNFRGLENLEQVNSVVNLIESDISSYEGLSGLKVVGALDYDDSFEVNDFTGLVSLTTVSAYVILDRNRNNITSFKGLEQVERIGDIFMTAGEVRTFEGLDNLRSVGSIDVDSSALESFKGLVGPLVVDESISVRGKGLDTDAFVDPSALVNVVRIGGNLVLTDNANLSDCCILPSLQSIAAGNIVLDNNAPECSSLEEVVIDCAEPVTVDCSPDSVFINTQAEVDAFTCTNVSNLFIGTQKSDDPITNLKALRSLTATEKDLFIGNNLQELTSLEGLDNLETIGGNLRFFASLSSLKGLDKLKSIGGRLELYETGLRNFVGLEALETIGGELSISQALENFKGLSNLKTIGGAISVRSGLSFVRFEGLSALESAGGFVIENNYLENFVGLPSLKNIKGSIQSQGTNGGIGSFEGLEDIEEIDGSIELAFNADFSGWGGLRNLRRIGGDLRLEQYSSDNFHGLEKLEEIGGQLYLLQNGVKSLEAFERLRSVGSVLIDSEPLASLDGLQSLRQVSSNFSLMATTVSDISSLQDIERIGGNLVLENNAQLTECCILLSILERVEGEISISNNAPECSSLEAVSDYCEEDTDSDENARLAKNIKAYPNPTVNFVQVRTDKSVFIGVYNAAGHQLSKQVIDQEGTIDMTSFPAGIYLLKAKGKIVQRIVKE